LRNTSIVAWTWCPSTFTLVMIFGVGHILFEHTVSKTANSVFYNVCKSNQIKIAVCNFNYCWCWHSYYFSNSNSSNSKLCMSRNDRLWAPNALCNNTILQIKTKTTKTCMVSRFLRHTIVIMPTRGPKMITRGGNPKCLHAKR